MISMNLSRSLADPSDPLVAAKMIGRGNKASAGAIVGHAAFTCAEAETFSQQQKPCILIRRETSADDISGMNVIEFRSISHPVLSIHFFKDSAIEMSKNVVS